ncbi:MAG: RNA-directed DNA polymerase [Deltaproteobacteria bacterium]|nr:RNA-directed DNA polymerase [Deltaproteobacteria bacterium]
MSDRRQEIYQRIRESSKDEVVLDEMVRLGFWPQQGVLPEDPAEEIKRQAALRDELASLTARLQKLGNQEALRQELKRRRLLESRRRRQETKLRRVHARELRAFEWKQKQRASITYLGEEVSRGLSNTASDEARLRALGLPVFHEASDIARAAQIEVSHLRHLAFHRVVSRRSHYVRFYLPKKTGGTRLISAPKPKLKWIQHWILRHVLEPLKAEDVAHGFVKARSIVSNASAHVGQDIVINVDLKDFFPTLTYRRVWGFFRKLGYSGHVATIFALLTTEPAVDELELDGSRYFVATGERFLPQGAPTSPALTNVICRKMDRRLAGLARTFGLTYTRYADDFTFSGPGETNVGRFFGALTRVVTEEGFSIHPGKTRIFRRGRRQEVTGLVVNSGKPTVPRATLRRFRALLFQIEKDGPEGKVWKPGVDVVRSIQGFARFVAMVDSEKGRALEARVQKIVAERGPASLASTRTVAKAKSHWYPPLKPLGEQPQLNLPHAQQDT